MPSTLSATRSRGEAREVAAATCRIGAEDRAGPRVILSGGELTVTRRGDGVGGPNAEYALALALALNGAPGIHAIACDTDGVDGAAEVAGAVIGPAQRWPAQGPRAPTRQGHWRINDAHGFFHKIDRQVVPGPTLTQCQRFPRHPDRGVTPGGPLFPSWRRLRENQGRSPAPIWPCPTFRASLAAIPEARAAHDRDHTSSRSPDGARLGTAILAARPPASQQAHEGHEWVHLHAYASEDWLPGVSARSRKNPSTTSRAGGDRAPPPRPAPPNWAKP